MTVASLGTDEAEPSPAPAPGSSSGAATAATDIVLVDDHPLLAAALRDRLEAEGQRVAVADLGERAAVIRSVMSYRPKLVVLDLGLPVDGGGLGLIHPLTSARLKVAVLTGETDRILWARCSAAGAAVILSKVEPLDDITWSIDRLLSDQTVKPHQRIELGDLYRAFQREHAEREAGFDRLSERESEVLAGLIAGESARRLAERDNVSIQTIRSQIKSVLSKLGVNSQLAAVARANTCGWRRQRPD